MSAREDDNSRNGGVEAFLASCAVSGDDAYSAARAVLECLQAPATRAEARRLLGAVRRCLADDPTAGQEERFRAFNLRIHDVVLQGRPPSSPLPVKSPGSPGGGSRDAVMRRTTGRKPWNVCGSWRIASWLPTTAMSISNIFNQICYDPLLHPLCHITGNCLDT